MTARKFYQTIIAIEVLSEEPIPAGTDLPDIVQESIDGEYSLRILKYYERPLNGKQVAKALLKQASAPSFFQLTEEGEELEVF